jgi:hypothetical protein
MHTLPSNWQEDLSAQPDRFGHRLPIPPQSAGRTQAGGAVVIAGPVLGAPPPLVPALLVPPPRPAPPLAL